MAFSAFLSINLGCFKEKMYLCTAFRYTKHIFCVMVN